MTTNTIYKEGLKAATNPIVELFELNTQIIDPVNGSVFYFTPMTEYVGPNGTFAEQYVKWSGITFTPFPIQVTGFEYTIDGAPPKPKLAVSNADKFLQAAVVSMGDLVGARLTRYRTFMNFLDGMPDADPSQRFPDDIFYVDQKTVHNRNIIEWNLISTIERGGIQLPFRQILRETGFPGVGRTRVK